LSLTYGKWNLRGIDVFFPPNLGVTQSMATPRQQPRRIRFGMTALAACVSLLFGASLLVALNAMRPPQHATPVASKIANNLR